MAYVAGTPPKPPDKGKTSFFDMHAHGFVRVATAVPRVAPPTCALDASTIDQNSVAAVAAVVALGGGAFAYQQQQDQSPQPRLLRLRLDAKTNLHRPAHQAIPQTSCLGPPNGSRR